MLSLKVGVVARPNRPHRRGLVSRVGLGRILKIGIRTSWAVDANVSRHADLGAAMGLTHHSDHGYLQKDVIDEKKQRLFVNNAKFGIFK